jgi:hypothetical protein
MLLEKADLSRRSHIDDVPLIHSFTSTTKGLRPLTSHHSSTAALEPTQPFPLSPCVQLFIASGSFAGHSKELRWVEDNLLYNSNSNASLSS